MVFERCEVEGFENGDMMGFYWGFFDLLGVWMRYVDLSRVFLVVL